MKTDAHTHTPLSKAARTDLRSRSLDFLRYPLAIVVLVVHTCSAHNFTNNGCDTDLLDFGAVRWLFLFVRAFLSDQSVPVYFFIAGYLFFLNISLTRQIYTRKLRNRFRSLLVPYVLWNLLAFAATLPSLPSPDAGTVVRRIGAALIGVAHEPDGLTFPADAPMWFVRNLMVMAAATPLLAWLLKRTGGWCVAFFGIVWALPATRHLGGWQLQEAVFFFSWGAWMSRGRREMMAEFGRFRRVSFAVYPTAAIAAALLSGPYPQAAYACKTVAIVSGLFFAYNIAAAIVSRHRTTAATRLAPAAFFVYSSHYIILAPTSRALASIIGPASAATGLAYYLLTAATTAAIATGAYAAMRRYTPRLLSPLVGGRI